MLGRYRIVRGKREADDPLPDGTRVDTRKHTRHCLRPTSELVEVALSINSPAGWAAFKGEYLQLLEQRWTSDRTPFDALADAARAERVSIGCNCPTKKQPDVERCHTVLALQFMKEKFPDLNVRFPE